MATQGLITIMQGDLVRAKIITGSDGQKIPAIAEALRENPITDAHKLVLLCDKHGLVGPSLIVQVAPEDCLDEQAEPVEMEELSALYVTQFYVPDFNPRWSHGTAEYTERVGFEEDMHRLVNVLRQNGL